MSQPSAPSPAIQPESPCPCGSGQTFEFCCAPFIQGVRRPDTAEQLMRSRYSAHVVRDHPYLHRTYLVSARKPYVEETDTVDFDWTRLEVHAHETRSTGSGQAGPKPDHATVDFSAYHREDGIEHAIHEKSEFQRIDGQWYYTRALRSGPAPVKSAQPKVGRNEPCPCGSGKKYKQCCGR